MMNRSLLAAFMLAATPFVAHAADATGQLRHFIDTVQSATGEFTQESMDKAAGKKAPQNGEFSFKRPARFKWHVLKPYEQLIVSDGKVVYQYDPDLQQVTERSVDKSIGASPAAILFGSGSLDEAFEITALPSAQGLEWLRAKPRAGDAGFTHLDIGLSGNLPRRLKILDAFGQTTLIELKNMVPNAPLAADAFEFSPPADVDVVKM